MAPPQQFLPAISAEQYLQLERVSEMRHEFVDGLMYAMAGESPITAVSALILRLKLGHK